MQRLGRGAASPAYLARQEIAPYGPVFLRRVFSCGDTPGHGWSQGGRLYAIGSEPYQLAKRVHRRNITINGQATVELDIQASHLMILAGLGHIPRPNGDPYDLDGLPRPIVKKWVQMTLSHGKRQTRWPTGAVKDLAKDGFDVKADYPLAETGNAILKYLPILKDDGSPAVSMGWGELQYRESEVILATVEVLAFAHDVPALPVHDSLIVPSEATKLAKAVLVRAFREAFGIDAVIG